MEVGDEMKEEEEDDTIETSYDNVQKKPKNQKTKEIKIMFQKQLQLLINQMINKVKI